MEKNVKLAWIFKEKRKNPQRTFILTVPLFFMPRTLEVGVQSFRNSHVRH